MRNKTYLRINNCIQSLLLTALLVFVGTAQAQPQLLLELSSSEQISTQHAQGEIVVRYVETDSIQPGAKISYRINFINQGNEPANRASLTGIIPENAFFLEVLDAAVDTEVRFSADEAQSFDFSPFSFTHVDEDGNASVIQAGPEHYTHIRFTLSKPIAPGASGFVRYLVQVN